MIRYILPFAVSALAAPAGAEVQLTSTGPVVELTVHETVEAEPDLVTVGAGVTTQASTAVEAMRANAQAMNSVVQRIRALGIPERDIQTTGISLGALVAAGATDLSGPDFSIEDDSAARSQARRAAMETAQAQAMEYARAAGYTGLRLLEISESVAVQPPIPFGRAVAAEAADASTPVQPGLVQAGVTVRVTYELTR